jgi:hypothetical protein
MTEANRTIRDRLLDKVRMIQLVTDYATDKKPVAPTVVRWIVDDSEMRGSLGLEVAFSEQLEDLAVRLRAEGVPVICRNCLLTANYRKKTFHILDTDDGTYLLLFGTRVNLPLSAASIARLLAFLDDVLPEVEDEVLCRAVQVQGEHLAGMVMAVTLESRLREKGFHTKVYYSLGGLIVAVYVGEERAFECRIKATDEACDKFLADAEKIISSAEYLYKRFGRRMIYGW